MKLYNKKIIILLTIYGIGGYVKRPSISPPIRKSIDFLTGDGLAIVLSPYVGDEMGVILTEEFSKFIWHFAECDDDNLLYKEEYVVEYSISSSFFSTRRVSKRKKVQKPKRKYIKKSKGNKM